MPDPQPVPVLDSDANPDSATPPEPDERLLSFLDYLHQRGALSVPPADLRTAVIEFDADLPPAPTDDPKTLLERRQDWLHNHVGEPFPEDLR